MQFALRARQEGRRDFDLPLWNVLIPGPLPLRKLNLPGVNLDDVSQAPDTILCDHSVIPGIHGQEFLSRPEQESDPTHIRLAGEKGKSEPGSRLEPKTGVVEGNSDGERM